jgi:hypothetical protein
MYDANNLEAALPAARMAMQHAQDARKAAVLTFIIGDALKVQGSTAEAAEAYRASRLFFAQAGMPDVSMAVGGFVGDALQKSGRHPDALEAYLSAWPIARSLLQASGDHVSPFARTVVLGIFATAQQCDGYSSALPALLEAVDLIDKIPTGQLVASELHRSLGAIYNVVLKDPGRAREEFALALRGDLPSSRDIHRLSFKRCN